MFDPVDYSSNQLYKLGQSSYTSPSKYYGITYGSSTIFIKRLRANKFGVCGLGTPFVPIKSQHDCDIFSVHDTLSGAVDDFKRLVSLILK